jgi:hypothetical protein
MTCEAICRQPQKSTLLQNATNPSWVPWWLVGVDGESVVRAWAGKIAGGSGGW